MINLRRPTEAILEPGSVRAEHLATGAVNLSSDKVTGEIDSTKIADGAVILTSPKVIGELPNEKLAPISDVAKLNDNLITLAKCQDDVKLTPYIGGEIEQSNNTNVDEFIIETGFSKTNKFTPNKIRIVASLKTSEITDEAILTCYIDNEVTGVMTLTSTSTEYEMVNGEIDISTLSNGRHYLKIAIRNTSGTAVVSNDYVDIFMVK